MLERLDYYVDKRLQAITKYQVQIELNANFVDVAPYLQIYYNKHYLQTTIFTDILHAPDMRTRSITYCVAYQFASRRMHSVQRTDFLERRAADVGDESNRYRSTYDCLMSFNSVGHCS